MIFLDGANEASLSRLPFDTLPETSSGQAGRGKPLPQDDLLNRFSEQTLVVLAAQ